MNQGHSRRHFLQGAAAAVVGFDLSTGLWVTAAEAATAGAFAAAPKLSGRLLLDTRHRRAVQNDLGNIISRLPAAVLEAGSVQDISAMIKFCGRNGIELATRGQGHSTYGQGLVSGLLIDSRALRTIHSIDAGGAYVDCGVLWRELVSAAYPLGLTPVAVTGYTKLSIGGTLSVGGIPAANSLRNGALVDNVQALEVVTGLGDIVTCSDTENADLFNAMLGGLGQCGVITKAKINMTSAPQFAMTYNINYAQSQAAAFFSDLQIMLTGGKFDSLYNLQFPPGTDLLYQMQATVFFDLPNAPDSGTLFSGLSVPALEASPRPLPYLTYMSYVDDVYDVEDIADFESYIKPWFDVILSAEAAAQFVPAVIANLSSQDIGPTGALTLLPQLRSAMKRPLLRLPDAGADGYVYMFELQTSATLPGADASFTEQMLARNRTLYEQARALGGYRYPPCAIEFSEQDWRDHYGDEFETFAVAKLTYDPRGTMTPGPGIFGPSPASTGSGPPGPIAATLKSLFGHGGLLGPEGLVSSLIHTPPL